MFALRTLRLAAAVRAVAPRQTRTFTSFLTPLRPRILLPSTTTATSTETGALDTLAPRISASPVLRALQVRNGPRNTFNPSHFVRKRRAGFLARLKSRTGRKVLTRRKLKGRRHLSH
ncbi:hypothetical protein EDC01DRAFT_667617 [Geopyxis carbonaria]|nr:hypothetical protein EDC01DRAFT_667617 [Geopyxis carbonaria]